MSQEISLKALGLLLRMLLPFRNKVCGVSMCAQAYVEAFHSYVLPYILFIAGHEAVTHASSYVMSSLSCRQHRDAV